MAAIMWSILFSLSGIAHGNDILLSSSAYQLMQSYIEAGKT
jgi:hypothetical protein